MRRSATEAAPSRLESLPASPVITAWWMYCGGSAPTARIAACCSGVFERWSFPRMTCVIPSCRSSMALAQLYVARPSPRRMTNGGRPGGRSQQAPSRISTPSAPEAASR